MRRRQQVDVSRIAAPLAVRIAAILERFVRREAQQIMYDRGVAAKALRKALLSPRMDARRADELAMLRLLEQYGLRQFVSASQRTAQAFGVEWAVPPEAYAEQTRRLTPLVSSMFNNTGQHVQAKLSEIMEAAFMQRPTLSAEVPHYTPETSRPTLATMAQDLRRETAHLVNLTLNDAERIAWTEVSTTENAGIYQGYRMARVEQIEWIATNDGRTRRSHVEVNGQVRPLGEPFVFRGMKGLMVSLRFPGDPTAPREEVIRCRCTTVPV